MAVHYAVQNREMGQTQMFDAAREGSDVRIDFLGIQAFLSIAERGSFQRAADHLHLSQTAISHRIRKLESDLGVQLLARTTREVTLTQAGLTFLPRARKALEDLQTSLEDLRQFNLEHQRRVTVACLPTFAFHLIPPVIAAFEKLRPGVEIRVLERLSSEVADLVQAGEAEFGFSLISTSRWDLDIEPVMSTQLVVACHRGGDLAACADIDWRAASLRPLIRLGTPTSIRILTDDVLSRLNLTPGWAYEVDNVETAMRLVARGVGEAIIPKLNIDLEPLDTVVGVPLVDPRSTCTFGLVTRRGHPLSPLAEQLSGLAVAHLKELQAG